MREIAGEFEKKYMLSHAVLFFIWSCKFDRPGTEKIENCCCRLLDISWRPMFEKTGNRRIKDGFCAKFEMGFDESCEKFLAFV
jgi:hypothetical protein